MSCGKCDNCIDGLDCRVSPEGRTLYWEQIAHDRLLEIARQRVEIMDLQAELTDLKNKRYDALNIKALHEEVDLAYKARDRAIKELEEIKGNK